MRRAFVLVAFAVCVLPIVSSAQAPAGKSLDIYFIDTEGGQATLYMSPGRTNAARGRRQRGRAGLEPDP